MLKKIRPISSKFLITLISASITSSALNQEITQTLPTTDSTDAVSQAVADVVREFYLGNGVEFEFIACGEVTSHMSDVINGAVGHLNADSIPVSLKLVKDILKWNNLLSQSAVILAESAETVRKLYEIATKISNPRSTQLTNVASKQFRFLIYCEDIRSIGQLRALLDYHEILFMYPGNFQFFEFFIVNGEKFVSFTASVFFSEGNCERFTPKVLNNFDKISRRWSQKLEDFDHYGNFHGCLLKFKTIFSGNLYVENYSVRYKSYDEISTLVSSEKVQFAGVLHEIVKLTAQKANFTFHYALQKIGSNNQLLEYNSRNYVPEDQTQISFLYTLYDLTQTRYDFSQPCDEIEMYYLVSLNDLYTNYEKLLLPFDTATWALLLLFTVSTFASIVALYRCPNWIRTKFFGDDVKNPAFNTLGIIFGISQLKLPLELFSRFILLLFLWFCLIFRTCYQSMMFEFMTTDMRKPLPATLDDLRDMNYTIVSHFTAIRLLEQQINGRERPNIVKINDLTDLTKLYGEVVAESTKEKYAFFVGKGFHEALNATFMRSLPRMENEKLLLSLSFAFIKNSVMINNVEKLLSHLITAGINKYHWECLNYKNTQRFVEDVVDSRRILSLTDLGYGFNMWLVTCAVSAVVFLLELTFVWFKKVRMQLAGLIGFLGAIRQF